MKSTIWSNHQINTTDAQQSPNPKNEGSKRERRDLYFDKNLFAQKTHPAKFIKTIHTHTLIKW